jgi:hypothetical protein
MSLQRRVLLQVLALAVVAGLAAPVPAADDPKADATGTWKSTFTTQNGQTFETTFKLKQQGDKLTGTVTGRDGKEVEVKNGKVKDGEASFDITRERNGQEFTFHYKGKLGADAIDGKVEFEANGETRSLDWKAKRQKSDKDGK